MTIAGFLAVLFLLLLLSAQLVICGFGKVLVILMVIGDGDIPSTLPHAPPSSSVASSPVIPNFRISWMEGTDISGDTTDTS